MIVMVATVGGLDLAAGAAAQDVAPPTPVQDLVDLSGEEVASIRPDSTSHVLARPWYENVDISGFGAADYLVTGPNGTRPNGGFLVRAASLFVRAFAWKNTELFMEIQAMPPGRNSAGTVRTSEVYAQFRNVLQRDGQNLLGLRLGRVAIPFGEEYDRTRVAQHALVLTSAPYPWGLDEGVLLFGSMAGWRWAAAVTDGADERSLDDDPSKGFNLRVQRRAFDGFELSGSLMSTGSTARTAMAFGGSSLVPVGRGTKSTLGVSPSGKVSARLYELDARWDFGRHGEHGSLSGFFGQAFQDDSTPEFDRTLTWFSVEPSWQFSRRAYVVARYSEIGTYDERGGYLLEGGMTAGGGEDFGFDARRLRRLSLGLGWRPNARVLAKAEVALDDFDLIDGANSAAGSDGRSTFGTELVLHF